MSEPVFSPDGQLQIQWSVRRGATFDKSYFWKTKDINAVVTPKLLVTEGWKGRAHIRESYTDEVPHIVLTTENGGIVLSDLGEVKIHIAAGLTETATLPDSCVVDVELYRDLSPTEEYVRNLVGGPVVFLPNATWGAT